jgi:diguanylate cyclase (GGDEF)-like protein
MRSPAPARADDSKTLSITSARRRFILTALAVLAGLSLALITGAFVVFSIWPGVAGCLYAVCDAPAWLSAVLTAWVGSLPVIVLGVVFAALGFDWALRWFRERNGAPDVDQTLARLEQSTQHNSDLARQLDHERQARELAEARADYALTHDALTGLINRTKINDLLGRAIQRGAKEETGVAIFFLDFDDFKYLNDTYGHSAGDQFLRLMGDRLRRALDCDDCVARIGGDEFLVLAENIEDENGATSIAEGLLKQIARPCEINGREVVVTTSIGISLYPSHAGDAHGLMNCADRAMYAAKQKGRNTYAVYA